MNARDKAKFRRLCEERGPMVLASFSRPLTRKEKARRKAIEAELDRLEAPDSRRSMARLEKMLAEAKRRAKLVQALVAEASQAAGPVVGRRR